MWLMALAVTLLQTADLPVTNMLLLSATVSCFELGTVVYRLDDKTDRLNFNGVYAVPKWNSIVLSFTGCLIYCWW